MSEQNVAELKVANTRAHAEHQYSQNRNNDDINSEHLKERLETILSICSDALNQARNGNINNAIKLYSYASSYAILPARNSHPVISTIIRPIQIYTLGRFSLLVDGRTDLHTRKASHRPMELLQCLIAFGSRQVSQYKIIENLWPDISGDSAIRVFNSTLYRLRQSLNCKQAVILKSGKLTLNPEYVWIDVWQLERLLSQFDSTHKKQESNPIELTKILHEIEKLYHGEFLGKSNENVWSIGYKEKLHKRILNIYKRIGNYYLNHNDPGNAIDCFSKGLDIDPLSESFYQELIKSYGAQRKYAEAAAVYQQCRKQLSMAFGVSPSPETIRLFKETVKP